MRALLLDSGNSRLKAAIAADGRIETLCVFDHNQVAEILDYAQKERAQACCLCDVSGKIDTLLAELRQAFRHLHLVSADSIVPFNTGAGFYTTMGSDRIAALVGAYVRVKPSPVLIIDAGTAITYDFLDERATYCGGLISLGIDMRRRALHTFTGRLPLVNVPSETSFPFTTKGTTQSLQSGIVAGIVGEFEYITRELKKKHNDFQIVVTGGDAECLSNFYFCKTFVVHNLVLEGLYELLMCNG